MNITPDVGDHLAAMLPGIGNEYAGEGALEVGATSSHAKAFSAGQSSRGAEAVDAVACTKTSFDEVVIRIERSEPCCDDEIECVQKFGTAYHFSVLHGSMWQAMAALVRKPPALWMEHVFLAGEGRFEVYHLPSDYEIQVGMVFEMQRGPVRPGRERLTSTRGPL